MCNTVTEAIGPTRCAVQISHMVKLYGVSEWASMAAGWLIILTTGVPIGLIVGTTIVWEAADRGFRGGLVESNEELSGLLFASVIPWLQKLIEPVTKRCVRNPEDSFIVLTTLYFALGLPLMLGLFGHLHTTCESTIMAVALCYVYHVCSSAVLCCAAPRCAVVCCGVLYCTVLCVLYCAALCCALLCGAVLCYALLCCVVR